MEELERGDIVWASDPLSENGRPMLVLGTPRFSPHGVQLITVLISTKTYDEAALTLRDDDYAGDPLGERRHVLPWSLATLDSTADVDRYVIGRRFPVLSALPRTPTALSQSMALIPADVTVDTYPPDLPR